MTALDPIREPPSCPICEQTLTPNTHLPEQVGAWTCTVCGGFYEGTTAEWVRLGYARTARRNREDAT